MALVVQNLPASLGDIRDRGWIPESGRSPGGGHGNPHQYSCLENPTDRGAWGAKVHRVAKSQTQLKWLSTLTPENDALPIRPARTVGFFCFVFFFFLNNRILQSPSHSPSFLVFFYLLKLIPSVLMSAPPNNYSLPPGLQCCGAHINLRSSAWKSLPIPPAKQSEEPRQSW